MQDSQMELLASSESWECEMDVDLMESLLVNLLDNAIKASKPGSVIELHGEKGLHLGPGFRKRNSGGRDTADYGGLLYGR